MVGFVDKCEIEFVYVIGIVRLLFIFIDIFGIGKVLEEKFVELVNKYFDLRLGVIIRDLDLRKFFYKKVVVYGYFGRIDIDLFWERIDKVE